MCADLEPAEVFRETERTARKPHRCEDCRRLIRPGRRYFDCFAFFDGTPWSFAHCARCNNLWHRCNSNVDCVAIGGLWEKVREMGKGNFLLALIDAGVFES